MRESEKSEKGKRPKTGKRRSSKGSGFTFVYDWFRAGHKFATSRRVNSKWRGKLDETFFESEPKNVKNTIIVEAPQKFLFL